MKLKIRSLMIMMMIGMDDDNDGSWLVKDDDHEWMIDYELTIMNDGKWIMW